MSGVHSSLVASFNRASDLARRGQFAEALSVYLNVLDRTRGSLPLAASPEFIATVDMRVGYMLMDMEMYDQALERFVGMWSRVKDLGPQGVYDYHFSLGNTYGALGRLEECAKSLIEAISVAEDMGDLSQRPQVVWRELIAACVTAKDWKRVEHWTKILVNNAGLRGWSKLGADAEATLQLARKHLQA